MAQAGYTPIQLYYSTTAAAVPLAANLAQGELAINIADGKLYYENSSGVVTLLAGAGGAGIVAGSNTQLQFNNSGVFGASANLTWDGTTLSSTQINITGQGTLRLQDTTGGEYVGLRAPASLGASYTLTWPADDGTSGQALITDGSGGLSWSTAASGDVYGPASSTDNAVARFDSTTGKIIQNSVVIVGDTGDVSGVGTLSAATLTLTNALGTAYGGTGLTSFTSGGVVYASSTSALATGSALTFDGTSLGIGTTSPLSKLNAKGTQGNWRIDPDSVASEIQLFTTTTGNDGFRDFRIRTNQTMFDVGGSEGMRLTTTGLGIGTSSPAFKLDVSGANAQSIRVTSTNGDLANLVMNSTGNASWSLSSDTVMRFKKDSTEYMRLDSAGNLGLGVTPSAWNSAFKAVQVATFASFAGDTQSTYVSANVYYGSGGWKYIGTGQASNYYQDLGSHVWRTAASGTAGNVISFTQAMTLDASGNLGIGTSSPQTQLAFGLGVFAGVKTYTTDGQSGLDFYRNSDTSQRFLDIYATASGNNASAGGSNIRFLTHSFSSTVSATERARFNSTGALVFAGGTTTADGIGITFPATQSASSDANTLDDYEEGTWTPSVAGTATYSNRLGNYTKIGNLVYIQCEITINLIGTGSTTTLSALPFISKNTGGVQAINLCYYLNSAVTMTWISGYVENNNTTIKFTGNSTTATSIQQNGFGIFGNSTTVILNACYITA